MWSALVAVALVGSAVPLGGWLGAVAEDRAAAAGLPPATRATLEAAARPAWIAVAVTVAAELVGLPLAAGLVGVSVAALAVAALGRGALAELGAGAALRAAGALRVGEWVEIGPREGLVASLDATGVTLRQPDGSFAFVAASQVLAWGVVNRSRTGQRRLQLRIAGGVDRAEAVRVRAADDARVLRDPAPALRWLTRDDGTAVAELTAYTAPGDHDAVRSDLARSLA